MKKTLLAVMLIAVTVLFLSCSNGSSGSSSDSGVKFKPELCAAEDCTEPVTTSSFSLSDGKWKRTDYYAYSSLREYYYYYEYEVSGTTATCTKYEKYEKREMSADEIQTLKRASKEDIKTLFGWDDYSFSGNTVTGVKKHSATLTAAETKQNTFSSYTGLTNADNTKYYLTYSSTNHEYFVKK